MAEAKTGIESKSKDEVTTIDHANSCILYNVKHIILPLRNVVNTFTAPNKEDRPAKCKLNIAKSTAALGWNSNVDKGGYTVHPVPAPPSVTKETSNNHSAAGNNQKPRLFTLGKVMSDVPHMIGKKILPKPPMSTGIIKKKIIKIACAVTKLLKSCPSLETKSGCGLIKFVLITIENTVPIIHEKMPKHIYIIPMFLWLVERTHLLKK